MASTQVISQICAMLKKYMTIYVWEDIPKFEKKNMSVLRIKMMISGFMFAEKRRVWSMN